MELGRDSDTGGQVKYVVELARALGMMPGVYRVDLLTRQVQAPGVDWTYGEPIEMLTPLGSDGLMNEVGESSGSYTCRRFHCDSVIGCIILLRDLVLQTQLDCQSKYWF